MSTRHKQFVETIRLKIDVEEGPSKSFSTETDEDVDTDNFDLQAELERKFDEIFGPLDDE